MVSIQLSPNIIVSSVHVQLSSNTTVSRFFLIFDLCKNDWPQTFFFALKPQLCQGKQKLLN